MKRIFFAGIAMSLACAILPLQGLSAPQKYTAAQLRNQITQAEYHVKQFEAEVAQQRGGEKAVYRSKKTALDRVQKLKVEFPDDPDVEKLYQRVRAALMKSKGDFVEVAEEWTRYKRNEDSLRKVIAREGEEKWKELVKAGGERFLPKAFPAPDSADIPLDKIKDSYVILEDVQYPAHQFYGVTGEFVHTGKPSLGYYFVAIGGRKWLGPYEAVKRYRRNVDTSLEDVRSWTVLGKISNIAYEIPEAGEEKKGSPRFGWVVEPVALLVPGHAAAWYDPDGEAGGRFAGEEKVDSIKDGWYTVKEIPEDVAPERLMEIFMTAVKEKNYKLYLDCIDPERSSTETGQDLLRYHWDLHQMRFHKEYVHAAFGKARITVLKGFDSGNEQENFFLDDRQKETLTRIGGTKIEQALVDSRAYDGNGKQIGSPHTHTLIRRGGGRWYVEDYHVRF